MFHSFVRRALFGAERLHFLTSAKIGFVTSARAQKAARSRLQAKFL